MIRSLVLLSFLGACGSSATTSPDAPVDCTNDPRVTAYAADMAVVGSQGQITFTLVAADPAPPGRGLNSWMVELSDASGPVAGAALVVTPYMPEHQHPAGTLPVVTEPAAGHYMIDMINLWMPGVWQTTIEATPAGGTKDVAVFGFCVKS
ncbi:MAG: FixH family protein [Deltaproteobacteria bacterium]|nr:FixH family protein [Deltaproteobacteria bacterium]